MKRSLRALRSPARRRAAVLTALVVVAAGTAFAVAGPLLHAAAPSSARTAAVVSGVLRAELDALQQAQLTRRPVTVSALTTEVSQTVANPSGTLTNTDYVEPVRVRQHGAWQPVSDTLRRDASGSWRPQAVPSGVSLSGGGGGPLATLTSVTGEQLSLSFPAPLPAPVVSGATATYKSVWPGIDLQVTVDTLGGLTWTVIARNAAAAANPALRTLPLGLSGPHLAVSSDQTGNLRATGPGGTAQFSGPPVTMWDSGTSGPAAASHHAGPSMKSTATAPGRAARIALIRGRFTGRTLRLTPAAAMLSRTSSYPVYLSASIAPDSTMLPNAVATPAVGQAATTNGLDHSDALNCDTVQNENEACISGNGFVEVQKGCSSATNYGTAQTEPGDSSAYTGNGIGYNWWNSCVGLYHSFYEFDTSSLIATLAAADATTPTANMWVQTATLDAWVPYSADWGCSDKWPAYLDWSGPINSATDWSNQPGTDADDQQKSYTTTPGPNPNSSCTQQEVDFDVTYAIADIVNSESDNITFRLIGDEADAAANEPTGSAPNLGFMRIGDNPNILTVFDLNPPTPTNLQTGPAAAYEPGGPAAYGCGDSTSNLPWIGAADDTNPAGNAVSQFSLQAQISAGITGEPVEARYTMWDNGTAIAANEVTGNEGASADWFTTSPATTNTPINFLLQDGERYTWTAQAFVSGNPEGSDPGYWSARAPTCGFNVDMTPPTTPAVTSTAFPPSGNGTNESYAGTSGTFSFSSTDPEPANCSECLTSGVYEFAYSLNTEDALTSDENTTQVGCGASTADATSGVVPANSSGAATSCPITPTLWGTNILYVAAVDKAGNVSNVTAYYFYVPWDPNKHPVPGDIDGDGIPDLLATGTGSDNDLTLYSGNTLPHSGGSTDLEPSTSTASTQADSPDGSSWQDYQITHRGPVSQVSASADVDDLYAHKTGGASLYLYKSNPSDPGKSPQFGDTSAITAIQRPTCSGSDCSGYGSSWSAVTQILSPGDAWNPTATADDTTDNGEPSLLTVENGELWLFQGNYAPGLQDPVELGSSGWGGVTLAAPGYVDGRLSIWAYDNTSGDMYNYLVYLVNGVPSLSSSSNTPIEAEQQGVFFAYRYPHAGVAVASAGPIDMYLQPGSGNGDVNLPGLFVATPPASVYTPERIYFYDGSYTSSAAGIPDPKDAVVEGSVIDPNQVTQTTCRNGCLWYYPLQQNGFTYSLSATPEFVGDLPAPVQSLS